MSDSKHVGGKLTFKQDDRCGNMLCAEDDQMVAQCNVWSLFDNEQSAIARAEQNAANARRLAACWNACDGKSTAVLELGRLSSDAFQMEESRADKAEQLCEDLLAHLEFMVSQVGQPRCLENRDGIAAAEAAIAKAKAPQFAIASQPSNGETSERLTTLKLIQPERYTHPTKGGSYEKLGAIRGAGSLKGLAGIAYRNDAGDLFVREPESFAARMQLIKADGGAE